MEAGDGKNEGSLMSDSRLKFGGMGDQGVTMEGIFCHGKFIVGICRRNFMEVGWLVIGHVKVFKDVFEVRWPTVRLGDGDQANESSLMPSSRLKFSGMGGQGVTMEGMFCHGEFNVRICGRNFGEIGWLVIGHVRVFRDVFGVR